MKEKTTEKKVYEPTKQEIEKITRVQNNYKHGLAQLKATIHAFSNHNPEEVYNASLDAYNMYREAVDDSLADNWKANIKRPTVRTKIVAVLSSFIKQMMIPSVKAFENSVPKEKRAEVMRSLLDYWRQKVEYDTVFREVMIEAVASPVTIIETGYQKVWKNKRIWDEKKEDYDIKVISDELLSGFFMKRLKFGEVLVANTEERNVQKQDWVIKREVHSYETIRTLYGKYKNWEYVEAGEYFSTEKNGYVEDTTGTLDGLAVEVVTYMSRTRDEHITIVNGVVIEDKPLSVKRVKGDYPFARIGAEPLTKEKGWFSYPMILRLKEDEDFRNHAYNLAFDAEYLSVFRPKAVSTDIGADAFMPSNITTVDTGFEIHDLAGSGSGQLLNVISKLDEEKEEFVPAHASGVKPQGEMSRRQWTDMTSNAFTSQGVFVAETKDFVEDITSLAINDLLQHLALSAVDKIRDGDIPATVIIRDGFKGDVAKDMQIIFSSPAAEETDPVRRSFDIARKERTDNTKIISINPKALFDTNFETYVTPETLKGNSDEDEQVLAQNRYNVASQNPAQFDAEFVAKDWAKHFYKSDMTKAIISPEKKQQMQQAAEQAQAQEAGKPKQAGGDQNQPNVETGAPVI